MLGTGTALFAVAPLDEFETVRLTVKICPTVTVEGVLPPIDSAKLAGLKMVTPGLVTELEVTVKVTP